MSNQGSFLKEFRSEISFLLKFIGLYFLLNTLYGLFVEAYAPTVDPITYFVSQNVEVLLSFFHKDVAITTDVNSKYVAVIHNQQTIINIFEGCNSVNVLIVFSVFMVSFSSRWIYYLKNLVFGIFILYLVNLARILLLFFISLHLPKSLYFFHKYFFTAIIYTVVFFLWFIWIKGIRKDAPSKVTR